MPDTYLNLDTNWTRKVVFEKFWRTTILQSSTGKEQRSALFTWPRRSIISQFNFFNFTDFARIKRKLYKYTHSVWGIPLWQDVSCLTSVATPGQTTLNVNTTNYTNLVSQTYCILIDNNYNFEVVKISSLTDTVITLTSALYSSWSIGTRLYPIINARISDRQRTKANTGTMGSISIKAKETFELNNDSPVYTEKSPSFSQYSGKYVFNIEPNWGREIPQLLTRETKLLQFLGYNFAETKTDEPTMKFDFDYFCNSRQEIDKIIAFFDYCKGRLKSFWVPTWQNDIKVTDSISVDDTTITIEDIEYTDFWLENTVFGRYLYFQMPGGNTSIKKVIAAPTDITLTLNEGMEYSCEMAQLSSLSVSFLALVRFAIDEIKINYHTSCSASITVRIQTVQDEL